MSGDRTKPPFSRTLTEMVFGAGGGVASTVYGTIVVMATLTVAYSTEKHPWRLAVLVSSTAFVLWIAHLYAHGLSESLARGRRLREVGLASIARREVGIVLAAVLPTAALLLGALGLLRVTSAVWLALGVGLLTLAAEGVRYARLEGFGRAGTALAVASNLALGSFVVVLKVAVSH